MIKGKRNYVFDHHDFLNGAHALNNLYARVHGAFFEQYSGKHARSSSVTMDPVLNPLSKLRRPLGVLQNQTYYIEGGKVDFASFGQPVNDVPLKSNHVPVLFERVYNFEIRINGVNEKVGEFVRKTIEDNLKCEQVKV